MNRRRSAAAVGIVLLALVGAGAGVVWGAFSGSTTNHGNELRAVPDFIAPVADRSVIQKAEGGVPGYIRQGGGYRVHANVTDSGNPSSGIVSVTANVSTLSAGQSAAPLSAGEFSAGGLSYTHRGASPTANATLAAGSYSYALTSTDGAAKSRLQPGFPVIVDNTASTSADVQATNKTGGIVGRPEIGDTVTLTYSEPIEPNSILANWSGAATNVVVRIDDIAFSNDRLAIYNAANTAQLPFGTVNLGRSDYVAASATFGASGTAATMTQSANAVTIRLGTASSGPMTAAFTGTMTWSPSATATDRAGNAHRTTARTESGSADKEF